jgi:hypothetical protein
MRGVYFFDEQIILPALQDEYKSLHIIEWCSDNSIDLYCSISARKLVVMSEIVVFFWRIPG